MCPHSETQRQLVGEGLKKTQPNIEVTKVFKRTVERADRSAVLLKVFLTPQYFYPAYSSLPGSQRMHCVSYCTFLLATSKDKGLQV